MVATTVVSILAGYALARFRFAGRQTFLLIFLATQMFPAVLLIAPLLSQWYALGLVDTYQALIYSNFSFTVPFTVWMLVGYFESIPKELEESAMLDGCNRFGALLRVVLPCGGGRHRDLCVRGVLERAAVRDHLHLADGDADALRRAPVHGGPVRDPVGAAVRRRHHQHGPGGDPLHVSPASPDPRALGGRCQG
jgi:hypothetical protein